MATETLEYTDPGERAEALVRALGATDAAVREALLSPLEDGDLDRLLLTAAAQQGAIFSRGTSDEDVEGIFSLMLSLIAGVKPANFEAVVRAIVDAATASADAKQAALRLRVVTSVYNHLAAGHKVLALFVLQRVVTFASEARLLEALLPAFAGAGSWAAKWGLTPAQAGSLFLLIARSLDKAGLAEEAQSFLIRYLATLEGAAPEELAAALPHARQAATNFVKAPVVSQKANLAGLAAIRALASDASSAPLVRLVDIFSHGSLADFQEFAAAHAAFLSELRLDVPASEEAMRLLTLCSLGAAARGPLSFDAIAAALRIPAGEVEAWIVRAMTTGMLEGRIDQASQAFAVTRSVQREFSAEQWRDLQDRLATWRTAVTSMLQTMEGQGRGGAPSAAAAAGGAF